VRWLALVESPEHVCCRYRISAFRPLLEPSGIALEAQTLPRRWWARLALYPRLRGRDVILQRRLLPSWELAALRRQVRHLVFDFDDAVFLRDSFAPKGLHDPRRQRRFAATVRVCDAVVAGNDFLAVESQRFADASRVHVIPTCVDVRQCVARSAKVAEATVDLVWIGSSSTLQGLERVAPLLEELDRAVPNLRLKVICDRAPHFRYLSVIPCPWTGATEAAEIAGADIGISWIPDDLWSRGKCGLKVLQYMAAGLPVVANSVGVHRDMVRHGQTGLLASTPAQWVAAIRTLAENPKLRHEMGRAGRRRVEELYDVAVGARAWLTLLDRLMARNCKAG
jgi:glycosyltransferase involved in cell wall biosynthesis